MWFCDAVLEWKMEKSNYTSGPIGRTMLRTAGGMLVGTLAMSGYNLADTYFVGQLGREPLAAMGFSFPVVMFIGCLFHGLGAGVMTPAAQALGGQHHEKAAGIVSSGLAFIGIFSLILGVVGIVTGNWLFSKMGAQGEALEQVTSYMNIWYCGCFTASLSMAGNSLLVAAGGPHAAGLSMVFGMVINVILDPIFIFGYCGAPKMGISGAALATIGSQFSVTVLLMFLLYRRYKLLQFERIPGRKLKIQWLSMIRFAVPASLGMLMMPIGSFIQTAITSHFGDAAVAAVAASGRLEMVAFVVPMSLGIALVPMIGQNYGARLYSRIRACRNFACSFATIYLLCAAVVYFLFFDRVVRFFSPDPEVQEIMKSAMKIIPWGFFAIEVHRFSGFFYTGCGRPIVAALLNALRILGLMIPFSFVALYIESLTGLFYARLAADLISVAVGFFFAYRMTEQLGKDGLPPPREGHPWSIQQWFPRLLRSYATSQADIDNRSSTQ